MKKGDSDTVQLCAQALCLEEMLRVSIASGALFYGKNRRRKEVVFDSTLRQKTEDTAQAVHELFSHGVTPPPLFDKRCRDCSLKVICQPEKATRTANRVGAYLRRERVRALTNSISENGF